MFETIITNGKLINPELKTITYGNIGISNGKITAITNSELVGKHIIDAKGLIVSPGFIDVHGHVDGNEYCSELSLRQGVTTTVGGNCGLSPIDINDFFEKQDKIGFSINQAEFIGHSFSLRREVGINDVYSAANSEELSKMKYLTEKALEEGACGISFGLDYAPGSSFQGVLELSKIAAKHNKLIAIHTRMFSEDDLDSLVEAIQISRVTGALVLISHFVYQYNEIMDKALALVDNAIKEGLNILIDSGMYTSWATSMGTATFSEEFIDKGVFDVGNMMVATGKYKGTHLNMELYRELRGKYPDECIIYHVDNHDNIYKALNKNYAMVSSDTGAYAKGEGHPQIAGTFPKFFKAMVRDRKDLSLIDAVSKVTYLPAKTIGLKKKGRLAEEMDADLVIFDIDKIRDTSNFPDVGPPDSYPEGIAHVLVNGVLALSNNQLKNSKAGRTIRLLK